MDGYTAVPEIQVDMLIATDLREGDVIAARGEVIRVTRHPVVGAYGLTLKVTAIVLATGDVWEDHVRVDEVLTKIGLSA